MCDEPSPGFLRGQIYAAQGRRLLRRDARAACQCPNHQAPPALTPTQYAERFLIGVGAVVALASADMIFHALVIALAATAGAVALGSAAYVACRVRRLRRRPVAELPAVPARTAVTGVRVRAIGAPRREGRAEVDTRAPARRVR